MTERCALCNGLIGDDEPLINCGIGPEHIECHDADEDYSAALIEDLEQQQNAALDGQNSDGLGSKTGGSE